MRTFWPTVVEFIQLLYVDFTETLPLTNFHIFLAWRDGGLTIFREGIAVVMHQAAIVVHCSQGISIVQ